MKTIPNQKIQDIVTDHLEKIQAGQRDFRF
jgi:hypothetical protein